MKSVHPERLLIEDDDEDNVEDSTTLRVSSHASGKRKLLLMISCLYVQFIFMAMIISLGIIYVELIDYFSAPRSQAALLEGLYLAMSLGGGVMFSGGLNSYDVGKGVIISSFLGSLCLLISSFPWNLQTVVVFGGFCIGLSHSYNLLTTYAVISWTFADSRKSALAVLCIGQAFAQLCVPFLTETLIDQYRWDGTLLVLSGFTFQCIPFGILISTSEGYFIKGDSRKMNLDDKTLPVYRDFIFLLFMTGYVIFASIGNPPQGFFMDVASLKGFTITDGAILLTVNGLFGLIGRISGTIIMHVFHELDPEIMLAISFLILTLVYAGLASIGGYSILLIGMIFRGIAAGLVFSSLPSLQIELRGDRQYPNTVAYCNFLVGLSLILVGFLGGYSADVTGTYDLVFYIDSGGAIYALLCMLLVLVLRKRRKIQFEYERLLD